MKTRFVTALMLAGGLALSVSVASRTFAEPPATEPGHKHDGDAGHKHEKKAEKKAEKKGVKIGDEAPAFALTDTDGKTVKLEDYKGKAVVLFWFNPECPGVSMHFTKETMTFNKLYEEYHTKGVQILAINSGAAGKQGSGKEFNAKMKTDWKMEYPILLDESGATGHAYGATNTPHVFVIGTDGKIAYKGAIDNGDFRSGTVGDKNYAKMALDKVLASKAADPAETVPYGCAVKYGK
ncbi:MAG TPA: redoxin domain-containing protein [Phycisphaerales bacterium]|nr:redoxin domain-containing protein [Phycisphaerales bacterium]